MNTYPINPWFLCYQNSTGVDRWAAPGALFVPSQVTCYNPVFQVARDRGAEVLDYFNVLSIPDKLVHPNMQEIYHWTPNTPLPTWSPVRSNWAETKLIDISRADVRNYFGNLLIKLARKGFDGFFCDTLGSRPWSKIANFEGWPPEEQAKWKGFTLEMAKTLFQASQVTNSIIVHNNNWGQDKRSGDKYCDGVCVEHPGASNVDFLRNYTVTGIFANRGRRRVPVVLNNDADVASWVDTQGATHICVDSTYDLALPPVVPYHGPDQSSEILRLTNQVEGLTKDKAALTTLNEDKARRLDEIHIISGSP